MARIVAASQSCPSASRSRPGQPACQRRLGTVTIGAENDLLAPTDVQPEHHKDAARPCGFHASLAIVTFTGSRFAAWTKRVLAGRAARLWIARRRNVLPWAASEDWAASTPGDALTPLHRDSSHPALIVQCVCTFGPALVDVLCGRPGHLKGNNGGGTAARRPTSRCGRRSCAAPFPKVLPQPWQELVANRLPRHDLVLGQRCDPAGRLRNHEGVAGGRQQPHAGDRDAGGGA